MSEQEQGPATGPHPRPRVEGAGEGTAGGLAEGGDPVCWLDRVCDTCGAFGEGDPGDPCWRCGAGGRP